MREFDCYVAWLVTVVWVVSVSEYDFFDYRNNFVLDDASVEFFFDDCVICPSYTGTYSIEIPIELLMPVLKKYKLNPLIG